MPTLTALPTTITAGDSYSITLTLADYPATVGWSLSYALAGASVLSVTSTASGVSHVLTLSAVQTALLDAGPYSYRLRAASGALVDTIDTGAITVAADLGTLTAGEGVPYYQQLKTAAETALLNLMESNAPQMMTVMGRQTMFRSPAECHRVIALCEARLALRNGRSPSGHIGVTFVRR